MIRQSIAKRYARGLFIAGEKDGKYKEYYGELDKVLSFMEGEQRIKRALTIPLMEMDKRKALLSDVMKALKVSTSLSNMLSLVLENNRMGYLPLIKEMYGELIDEKEERVRGTMWSPFPVDEQIKEMVQKALKEKFGKDVILETVEDKTLIGGVRVKIKDIIIDGSVKKQLETIKENILKE